MGTSGADERRHVPWRGLACFLVAFPVGLILFGLLIYANEGFPHGSKVFTGEFEEMCQYEGRDCALVEVYEVDTSGLDNPWWVTVLRRIEVFVFFGGPALVIFGLVQGVSTLRWWRSINVTKQT